MLVASASAQLTLPAHSGETTVYSQSCDRKCFSGSATIYPEVSGSSNTYCTNPLGCNWRWHMEVAPCSGALLAFDASVGLDTVSFSTIDPAVYRELRFVCTDSGDSGGVVLAVHTESWMQPLMQWTFLSTSCANMMASGFNDSDALFENAFVNVKLSAQNWFSLVTTSLLDSETECDALPLKCERCFSGAQIVELPINASAALIQACGLTPDAIAQSSDVFGECSVGWQFCVDACRGSSDSGDAWHTTDIDVILGTGGLTPLGHLNEQGAKRLAIRMGALPDGGTVLALTDATSLESLTAGSSATFYLAWTYATADPIELLLATRRDFLFVALDFALLTDDDELLRISAQSGPQNALGSFVWDGLSSTGIDAFVRAARALNEREQGLVAGLVCVSVLATIFFLLFIYCWYKRHTEQQPEEVRHRRRSKLVSAQERTDAQSRKAKRQASIYVSDNAEERAAEAAANEADEKIISSYDSQRSQRLVAGVSGILHDAAGMAKMAYHALATNEDDGGEGE